MMVRPHTYGNHDFITACTSEIPRHTRACMLL